MDSVQIPESELFTDQTAPKKAVRKGLWRARMASGALPRLSTMSVMSLGPLAFAAGWKIGRTLDTKVLGLSCAIEDCGDNAHVAGPVALEGVQWTYQTNSLAETGPFWLAGIYAGGQFGQNLIGCTAVTAEAPCNDGYRTTMYTKLQSLPGTMHQHVPTGRYYKTISAAAMEAAMTPEAFHTYTPADDASITNTTTGHATAHNAPAAEAALDAEPSHLPEEWINFRLDPEYAPDPFSFDMPQCVGSLVALCISDLDEAGHTGTLVITVADFNGADTSKPATSVLTQSEPAYTTVPFTTTITIHGNPDAEDMPLLVPEPAPGPAGETFEEYITRLGLLGWTGSATSTVLESNLADPERGPEDVVTTSPAPGTRIPPNTPVTVRLNPPDWPAPGDPGDEDADCPCPIHSLDFSALQVDEVCAKFPFGVFCWIEDQISLLFGSAAEAPHFEFQVGEIATELATIPADSLNFSIDLDDAPAPVDTLISAVRVVLSFVVWLVGLWFMGRRMLQRNDTLDGAGVSEDVASSA